MSERRVRLSVIVPEADHVLSALGAALSGAGPAIAPTGDPRMLEALRSDQPIEDEGIAVVLPTSGSTGEAKGVNLTGKALTHSAMATLDRLGGAGQWLLALPVDRIAGLQVLVRSLLGGTTPVQLAPGPFTASAFAEATRRLDAAQRHYTALVPTQLTRLLDAGGDAIDAVLSYKKILLGGAAANATLLRKARELGISIVTTYGMTETCGGCVYDGAPLEDVEVDLAADGRIRIVGPVLFAGYRLRPDLTADAFDNGRFVTADLGRIDEDGRLDVIGRVDEVVISGGVNVPLPAVENTLHAMPGIAEAAVIGVPDPVWGSRVVAFFTVREEAGAPSLQEIREHVSSLHPRAYAPRKAIVLDALPMLPSGKVDRQALIARASSS